MNYMNVYEDINLRTEYICVYVYIIHHIREWFTLS
jgi:hypothetical protein